MRTGVQPGDQQYVKNGQHFYRRVPVVPQRYEADDADLVPAPAKKRGAVEVEMADATLVKIRTSKQDTQHFTATELPELRFKGALKVQDVPDDEVEAESVDTAELREVDTDTEAAASSPDTRTEPAAVPSVESVDNSVSVVHRRGRAPLHTYTKAQKAQRTPLYNPDGVIGMERVNSVGRNPRAAGTIAIPAQPATTRSLAPVIIGVATLASVAIALVMVSGTQAVSSDGVVTSRFSFDGAAFVSVVKTQLSALLFHSF